MADRQVEAGEAVLELARQPGGGPREALVVLGGDDHGELRGRLALLRALASAPGASERSARRVRVRTRARHSPVCAARGRGADDQHPGPALEVGAHLGGAGDDVAAVGDLAGEDRADEGAGDLLALPLRRAGALQLQRRAASSPSGRSPGSASALAR